MRPTARPDLPGVPQVRTRRLAHRQAVHDAKVLRKIHRLNRAAFAREAAADPIRPSDRIVMVDDTSASIDGRLLASGPTE